MNGIVDLVMINNWIRVLDILKENNVYFIPYSMTALFDIIKQENKPPLIPAYEGLLIYKKEVRDLTEEIWQEIVSTYIDKYINLGAAEYLIHFNSLEKFAVIIASKINSVMKNYEKLLKLLKKDEKELIEKKSIKSSDGGITGYDMPGQKVGNLPPNNTDYIDSKTTSESNDDVTVTDYSAAERILSEISKIKKKIVFEVAYNLFKTVANDRLGIC